jgi:hypothetical protein
MINSSDLKFHRKRDFYVTNWILEPETCRKIKIIKTGRADGLSVSLAMSKMEYQRSLNEVKEILKFKYESGLMSLQTTLEDAYWRIKPKGKRG